MDTKSCKTLLSGLIAAAAMLTGSHALAAPVSCPGTAVTTDREFTVDAIPSATCFRTGNGNINGNGTGNNADPIIAIEGFTLIDKTDTSGGAFNGALNVTGVGSTSGSFTINPAVYSLFDQIAIGFKSGEGQRNPDWAVFLLADGTTAGTFSISGNQSLSHANLYGRGTPPAQVPVPGTIALVGLGLLGAGAARRRAA